jgi:hypothetical protein
MILNYAISCALSLQPFLKEDLPHLNFELVYITADRFYADDWKTLSKRELKAAYKADTQLFAELKVHVVDWKTGDCAESDATN